MARAPYRPLEITEQLRPTAAPVQSYVQPARSNLRDLAESLVPVSRELGEFMEGRAKKQKADDEIRGKAAFYDENSESLAEAVRSGKVPSQYSPAFVRGFKNAQGDVAGTKMVQEFNAAFDAWDGKNSDDPAQYDAFIQDFIKSKVGTEDPDVLRALLPHVEQVVAGGSARYTQYRHEQTYKGSLDANLAAANQAIDAENSAGLSSEKGTDYAKVYASIAEKRNAFVTSGGKPEDFDKSMIDGLSNKVLSTRDPGLLGFFDQKVPGTDHTYGDTPYGAIVKQNTLEALEVVSRSHTTEEAARQKREDEANKDAAQREAVDILAADPSKPLPDELLNRGQKYDPTFRVRIEEWRKSLGTGYTDPAKLKDVYSAVLAGGGFKAIQDAASQGVFGRPEDLTAAYSFAKGFEDNKDLINDTLGSASARGILDAIDIRTKGRNNLTGDPITGMSNEGMEAQYDYKRLVQEWVVNNPNATPMEREEGIAKIGKMILDRIPERDAEDPFAPGSPYERPEALGESFANPYSDGTAPVTQPTGGPETPEQTFMKGLTPEQKKVFEERAKAQGITTEEFLKKTGAANSEKPKPIAYDPNDTDLGEGDARESGFTPEQAEGFLTEALAASPAGGGSTGNSGSALLELIGKHEARGNYNAVYGNANSKRDLSTFTLDDILGHQQAARRAGAPSTAIGKYQFIYKTLRGLKEELGLKGTEAFTPELQDELGTQLLKRRGLDDFLSGRISKRTFAFRLSQEWASLANPNTGRSFYAGDGLNASSASASKVYAAMNMVVPASYSPDTSPAVAPSGVSPAYANIPDVDGSGQAGQQAKFMEWNPDPVGNHEKNLSSINPTLADVVRLAQTKTSQKFVVGSGKRDRAIQKKAVEWGWSKTADESDHLDGSAVDLWALDKAGAVVFEKKQQREIMKAMKQAAKELGVDLDVGGDWKSFKDLPHFALKSKSIRT